MALEKECDDVLGFIYCNRLSPSGMNWLYHELKEKFPETEDRIFENILSIMFHDGLLYDIFEENKLPKRNEPMVFFDLTPKGIAFYCSDTYIERSKRWDLEKKSKILEYELKKKTFWIAIISLLFSAISLFLSIKKDVNKPSNDASDAKKNRNISNKIVKP